MADTSIYSDIAAAFGTTFEPEEDENTIVSPVKSLTEISDTFKAKQELLVTDNEVLEDQTYIQQELRIDIEILGDIVETVRSGLTSSSNPNQVRSLVEAMKERREHLRELKEINTKVHEIKYPQSNGGGTPGLPTGGNFTQNNLVMTGSDAIDMIRAMLDNPKPTDCEVI